MNKTYEVEVRGLLTPEEHKNLLSFMDKHANKKEEDNRETTFFMIPNKTLKVTSKLNKQSAKIALKTGNIVTSKAQQEFEIDIPSNQTSTAISLFTELGFTEVQHTKQDRINYWINGYEFAVKWSKDLQHHFEAETIVYHEHEISNAHKTLVDYVKSINLTPLTEDEFRTICENVDKRHRELNNQQTA